jgi:hypothetical protein
MREYSLRRSKKSTKEESNDRISAIADHFRIYFPSESTIAASRGGKSVS